MNILAAIKREERKLEKQLGELHSRREGVRDAAKALGRSTNHSVRKLSAEARAQISNLPVILIVLALLVLFLLHRTRQAALPQPERVVAH
jgi:hypothetical protein